MWPHAQCRPSPGSLRSPPSPRKRGEGKRACRYGLAYNDFMFPPARIVCLTEETVETLYLLGEDKRIVGVSGYAVRPPRVRKEKPRVSAFISADVPKILALEARPRPHLLRSAGRHRRRVDPQQRRGPRLQPARHRRHLRHDPHARRAGRPVGESRDAGAHAGNAAASGAGAIGRNCRAGRASISRNGTNR